MQTKIIKVLTAVWIPTSKKLYTAHPRLVLTFKFYNGVFCKTTGVVAILHITKRCSNYRHIMLNSLLVPEFLREPIRPSVKKFGSHLPHPLFLILCPEPIFVQVFIDQRPILILCALPIFNYSSGIQAQPRITMRNRRLLDRDYLIQRVKGQRRFDNHAVETPKILVKPFPDVIGPGLFQ